MNLLWFFPKSDNCSTYHSLLQSLVILLIHSTCAILELSRTIWKNAYSQLHSCSVQLHFQKPKEIENQMKLNHTKMPTRRCSYLTAVAMANNISEVWICGQPILLFTYMIQYLPLVAFWSVFLRHTPNLYLQSHSQPIVSVTLPAYCLTLTHSMAEHTIVNY